MVGTVQVLFYSALEAFSKKVFLPLPFSRRRLHRHGNQDGAELSVQISEALRCGEVRWQSQHFHELVISDASTSPRRFPSGPLQVHERLPHRVSVHPDQQSRDQHRPQVRLAVVAGPGRALVQPQDGKRASASRGQWNNPWI